MIFDQLEHFTEHEAWGDYTRMNGTLLITLDYVRHYVDSRFHINCAYSNSGHSATGEHPKGNAIDFTIPNMPIRFAYEKLVRSFYALQIVDRIGFGLYLDWNTPGFHIDLRGTRARWGRIEGEYVAIQKAVALL